MKTATQSLSDDEVELIAAELEREVTIKHADDEDVEPESYDDAEESLRDAPAGRHDHGPRRPRQDDAARRDPRDGRRRDRGRRDHAAHRRLPDRGRRPEDHLPGHAGPRGVHRHARPRREGDRHRGARRRRRRQRHAADERVDLARARRRGADRRRREQDRPARREPRPRARRARDRRACSPRSGAARRRSRGSRRSSARASTSCSSRSCSSPTPSSILKANPNAEASGPIIESRLDVGRGPVATMLVHRGTLKVGDAIVAGDAWGRVRALYDYRGERLETRRPGRSGRDPRLRQAAAGRRGRAASSRTTAAPATSRTSAASALRREALAKQASRGVSLEKLFEQLQAGGVADLNIVLKADVQGSVEAIVGELREDRAPRGARQRDPHRRRRDHRERRQPRRRVQRDGDRLQRAAVDRGAPARRPAGDRDPPVPRDLRADPADRAGARRHALAGRDRGRDRRGRGARAVHASRALGTIAGCMVTSGVVRRNCERAHLPRRRPHPRDDDRAAQAVQGRRPRGGRGLRVRHPARGLQRPPRGRHLRGLRDARGRADVARRAAASRSAGAGRRDES